MCMRCHRESDIHVIPEDDLLDHEQTQLCWCQPYLFREDEDCELMVIHNALDGRKQNTDFKPQ